MEAVRSRYQLAEEVGDDRVIRYFVVDEVADYPFMEPTTDRKGCEVFLREIRDDLEGPDPDNPRSI